MGDKGTCDGCGAIKNKKIIHAITGLKCRTVSNRLLAISGLVYLPNHVTGKSICSLCIARFGEVFSIVSKLTCISVDELRGGHKYSTPPVTPVKKTHVEEPKPGQRKRGPSTPTHLRETPRKEIPLKRVAELPTLSDECENLDISAAFGNLTFDDDDKPHQPISASTPAGKNTSRKKRLFEDDHDVDDDIGVGALADLSLKDDFPHKPVDEDEEVLPPRSEKPSDSPECHDHELVINHPVIGESGLYFSEEYLIPNKLSLQDAAILRRISVTRDVGQFIQEIVNSKFLTTLVKRLSLHIIDLEATRASQLGPVLQNLAPIKTLAEMDGDITMSIINECVEKCRFLLDVLVTVSTGTKVPRADHLAAPICLVYSILMNRRNHLFSAMQRVLTLVLTRGGANERCLETLHKMGVTLTNKTRLKLLDECGLASKQRLERLRNDCGLCHFVGDNMDIKIRPTIVQSDHQVKDCHFYAIIVVFSNISNKLIEMKRLETEGPNNSERRTSSPEPEQILLSPDEREDLLKSYGHQLLKLMANNCEAFSWMKDIIPSHYPHQWDEFTSQKTRICSQPLIYKDEKALDQCIDILDSTSSENKEYLLKGEQMTGFSTLPYHGDQLTRVRLQSAKLLRAQADDPILAFDHIGPFLITLWHMKQDFLEKAMRIFYDSKSAQDKGTLFFFKVILHLTNVNGEVKGGKYASSENLFLLVGEFVLMEQVLEYLEMDNYDAWPSMVPENVNDLTNDEKIVIANKIVRAILTDYNYGGFSIDGTETCKNNPPRETEITRMVTDDGKTIVTKLRLPPTGEEDEVMSYFLNFGMWAMHLLHMNDAAKEGDPARAILTVKACIPFFYAHSPLSKYFIECIDYIVKTQYLGSPADQLRLLEGSFTNAKGGKGRCVEADLPMEHRVGWIKEMIMSLGANKTERAMSRVTMAGDVTVLLTDSLKTSIGVKDRSGRHSHRISEVDRAKVKGVLRKVRPMKFQSGRQFKQMKYVPYNPFIRIDKIKMKRAIETNISRSLTGCMDTYGNEEELSQEVQESESESAGISSDNELYDDVDL